MNLQIGFNWLGTGTNGRSLCNGSKSLISIKFVVLVERITAEDVTTDTQRNKLNTMKFRY
jgi:hypothetical protein